MKNKHSKFLDDKDFVVENLQTLKINLEEIEEFGFQDPDETLYNELLSIIEDAKISDSELALLQVITRARVIETKLDNFYAHQGIETMQLTWPQI